MEEQERKEGKNRVFLLRWLAAAGVPIESSSLKSQPAHTQARPAAAAAGVEEGAEKGSWGSSRKKNRRKNATTAISVFAKKLRK